MKLIHREIDSKNKKGYVVLIAEEEEDMWHVYNILQEGDLIRASTMRKVITETITGSTGANKVRTTLTIKIEAIDYDFDACMLRVKGKNVEENQYVKLGQYHTIDIELNRKFTLTKNEWDSYSLERLENACDPTKNADLAAVIMNEGIANVCLITDSMTLVRSKIDCHIPRKRKGHCDQHEKGLKKFFEQITQAILRHINFEVVKCCLIASPGFVKDQYYEYLMDYAQKMDNKTIIENRSKFILCHSSSGFKHSLKEVLADPLLQNRLADTKAAKEVKALQDFQRMLMTDPERAFYGLRHIEKAINESAIETLLISDRLFRYNDIQIRKKYIEIVDKVRESGGDVRIFSSLHVSGEQLDQYTGIAAILRFPVADFEDEDDLDDDGDGEDEQHKERGDSNILNAKQQQGHKMSEKNINDEHDLNHS